MHAVIIFQEREKFITRQPPIGENDDFDSRLSWILDEFPSSNSSQRRGEREVELSHLTQIFHHQTHKVTRST